MTIDDQSAYWDQVAFTKTFTHPLDVELLGRFVNMDACIVDYGCGYGRLTQQLIDLGYNNVRGFDTSAELIRRGTGDRELPLYYIAGAEKIKEHIPEQTVDCILLFAVLTCIPSNKAQEDLISLLHSLLKPGGIIYISDYYLQTDRQEEKQYDTLNGDEQNYGVFTLPEGVTFRHHTREWIKHLLRHFAIVEDRQMPVTTMNRHTGTAFQVIAQKL